MHNALNEREKIEKFGICRILKQRRFSRIFMDFEAVSRVAVTTIFPDADVEGCFFLFTQWVWRKAQATGLAIPYKDNEDVHRLVRGAAVLPLVPVPGVADVWFEALNDLKGVPQTSTTSSQHYNKLRHRTV